MLSTPSVFNRASDLNWDGAEKRVGQSTGAISISRVLRRMRGGSQSLLVQCDDDHFYVAKFMGNPQGNRTLINEVIAHRLMKHLGVSTPNLCLLTLPESVQLREDISFYTDNRRGPPQSGLHLGSKCPANPEKMAIFDFLPAKLFPRISNINEFASMFVVDKWLHHIDKRQAVFLNDPKVKGGYKAHFIDHGMTLGGKDWELRDVSLYGLAFQGSIYSMLDIRALTMAAVVVVQSISPATLQAASDDVPGEWFGPGDRECLATLMVGLEKRQASLPSLVSRHLDELNKLHTFQP